MPCPLPLQNPPPAKSGAFKAFPSTTSLFTIGMIKFSLFFSLLSSPSSFFSPNNHPSKTTGKARRVYFFDRADRGGRRRHRREKNPEKVEGRKCCRFFKILSSASSSTLLHPLVSARGSLCQSFHGQEPVLETRSKPKAIRIHIYNETRHRLPQRISRHRSSVIITRYALPFSIGRWTALGRRGKVR